MNEGFNNLFRKPKERNKGEVFYITKKVKGKDGKRIEKEFVSVAGIELEVNKEGRGTQFDKSEFEDFALDKKTLELLKIYAKAIKLNQPPLVEGPTDIGKSKVLEYLAFLTNNFLIYQSFSGQTDVSELIGKYVPNTEDARKTFERILSYKNRGSLKTKTLEIINKVSQGEEIRGLTEEECKQIAKLEGLSFEKVDWVWQNGTVPTAMEYDGGLGCWLYFDELGAAEPQILVKLNRIFARGKKRIEITENGSREVIAGDNFRLVASTNPPSYAGREPFEKDFIRRWVYQKVGALRQEDFLARLNFVGHGKEKEKRKNKDKFFEDGKINLDNFSEIDIILNEVIGMFAFQAQTYLDSVPKDPGEQDFRLKDFTDALRVQQYLRELQGEDLIETLKEAIEFYYLGKVDEDKKDSSDKFVQAKLKEILNIIITQKKVEEKIQDEIKKHQSPEILEDEKDFDKKRADLDSRLADLDLEKIIGVERKGKITEIKEKNPEGQEIKFELKEQSKYWNQFYEENGVSWTEPIPEDISVTAEQETEMKRLIKEYGFDKMIIIPAGLVGEPEVEEDSETSSGFRLKKPAENYEELHKLMSAGYNESYQSANYKKDGGLGASLDTRQGLRIILTKEVQEIEDDDLLKKTLGKSVKELESGIFKETGLGGLTESEYLVYQFEYYKRTGKHLDEKKWTWLPASRRLVSGRVPSSLWDPGDGQLYFNSFPDVFRYVSLGCRFVGSFSIVI